MSRSPETPHARVFLAVLLMLGPVLTVSALHAPDAAASDMSGIAEDDTVTIRGRDQLTLTSTTKQTLNGDSRVHRYCIPIGLGQFRCYSADPATLWTINATSVLGVAPGTSDFDAAVATEFRRIQLNPSGIAVQPARGWTLVNVDTIVMTDPTPQTHAVTVLGIPVTVRATPVLYSWDFGDATAPLVTSEPGSPWPHPTVTHVYRTAATRTITLTTDWAGEYQVSGSAVWQPIVGFATTTDTAPPLEVRSATSALVAHH